MPKDLRKKGSSHSLLKGFWELGVLLIGGARPLLNRLRQELTGQLDHYAGMLERRIAVLALYGLMVSFGLISIWVGLLLITIDAGVPRGIACLGGGFSVLVFVLLFLQLTKQKGRPA
jgi:hypothetical protein